MLSFVEIDYKVTTELPELESRLQRYVKLVSQLVGPNADLDTQGDTMRQEIESTLMLLLETKMQLQGVSPSVDDGDGNSNEEKEEVASIQATAGAAVSGGSPLENARTMQRTKILNGYIEEYTRLKQLLVTTQTSVKFRRLGGGQALSPGEDATFEKTAKIHELVTRATNLQAPVAQLKEHQILLRNGLDEDAKLLGELDSDLEDQIAGAHTATRNTRAVARALCRHNSCKYMGIAVSFGVLLIACIIWL